MKLSTITLAFTPMSLLMFLAVTYAWFGEQVFIAALAPEIFAAAVAQIFVWRMVRNDRKRAAEPANG